MTTSELDVHKTIVVLAAASLAGFFLFQAAWLIPVAFVLLVLLIVGGPVPRAIAAAWLGFAHILGRVNATIILSLVYGLILTPIAIVFRVVNKEARQYVVDRTAPTMLVPHTETIDTSFFKRQW